jgi:hypothetical protein
VGNPFTRKLKKRGLDPKDTLGIIESRLKREHSQRTAQQAYSALLKASGLELQGLMKDKLRAARFACALSDAPMDWSDLMHDVIRALRMPANCTAESDAPHAARGSP